MTEPGGFERTAKEIVARYPHHRSALMPLLYLLQSEDGHVSREGMQRVASALGLTTAEVEAVVTFYTMFRRPPCGDYLVSVCTNLSCALLGARRIYERALELAGHDAQRGISEDGLITVHEEECLAACDGAPVVQVNFANYERVTEEGIEEIVAGIRSGSLPQPARGPAPGTLKQTSRVLAGLAGSDGGGGG